MNRCFGRRSILNLSVLQKPNHVVMGSGLGIRVSLQVAVRYNDLPKLGAKISSLHPTN